MSIIFKFGIVVFFNRVLFEEDLGTWSKPAEVITTIIIVFFNVLDLFDRLDAFLFSFFLFDLLSFTCVSWICM